MATAEILRIISSSPTNVQPVFDAIAANSLRLCAARISAVYRFDGELMHLVAHANFSSEALALLQTTFPRRPHETSHVGRAVREGAAVNVADVAGTGDVPHGSHRHAARLAGYHGFLAIPMLREGQVVGCIALGRDAAEPFPEDQMSLIQTFAAQAVIAIENVRLFNELQEKNRAVSEALQQQTATAEILRVISSSPTEVQPVFDVIARFAVQLSEATFGGVMPFDGEVVYVGAAHNVDPDRQRTFEQFFPMRPIGLLADAIHGGHVVHSEDVLTDPRVRFHDASRVLNYRTFLAVPMIRTTQTIGAVIVVRTEAKAFSERQIKLLQMFADQAVIAIENVRLYTELQDRNRTLTRAHAQVTEALEQQTATAEILRVMSGSLTDAAPVFDTIAERATRLTGAHFSVVFRFDGQNADVATIRPSGLSFEDEYRRTYPVAVQPGSPFAATLLEGQIRYTEDTEAEWSRTGRERARLLGFRSSLWVPMLKDGRAVGMIAVARRAAGRFSDQETVTPRVSPSGA